MTDRELLELAAKAIGTYYGMYVEKEPIQGEVRTGLWDDLIDYCWNPLIDDGDSFRLAVKLGINVQFFPEAKVLAEALYGADRYAATRRAIVLAAAEIGRSK